MGRVTFDSLEGWSRKAEVGGRGAEQQVIASMRVGGSPETGRAEIRL